MPRPNGITRQEILTSIKYGGALTAEELASALGISQVAVRQHLSALEAEDIISVSIERRGLGRPAHRYTLTRRGDENFPRRYDEFALGLLEELGASHGDEALQTLAAQWRERQLAARLAGTEGNSLSSKVREIARALTDNGYMAEVIEDQNGNCQLIKRNCAIYAVACKHPQMCCHQDAALYEKLLENAKVRRETSILEGDSTCTFCIRECLPEDEAEQRTDSV